jgi:aerobic-type carbon monoxide dehydrogenase small subunit (CoxS/CutS family)
MIQFTLNGQTVQTDVDPSTPLLWVVRDHFKLKGSKFGCGAGLCGACTMHVDGAALKTCVTPIAAVGTSRLRPLRAGHAGGFASSAGGLARARGAPVWLLPVGSDYGGGGAA